MLTQGLYDGIDMADYLADPCEQPSLSSSLIKLICERSPWHAWAASPRLNPDYQRKEDSRFDLGTAVHAFALQGASNFDIVPAEDWRSKDAQTRRDAARLAGRTPLLRSQWEQVGAIAEAMGHQLNAVEDPRPFTDPGGKPEQTIVWLEDGVWCRARLDWLHDSYRVVDDLKTTVGSANPEIWSRTMFTLGYDIQAAWYLRGVQAVLGTNAVFRFVVVETEAPHALSVVALAPDALELGRQKVEYALGIWRQCLETNVWPGYPTQTAYAEAPPWEIARWERTLYVPPVYDDGRPLEDQL